MNDLLNKRQQNLDQLQAALEEDKKARERYRILQEEQLREAGQQLTAQRALIERNFARQQALRFSEQLQTIIRDSLGLTKITAEVSNEARIGNDDICFSLSLDLGSHYKTHNKLLLHVRASSSISDRRTEILLLNGDLPNGKTREEWQQERDKLQRALSSFSYSSPASNRTQAEAALTQHDAALIRLSVNPAQIILFDRVELGFAEATRQKVDSLDGLLVYLRSALRGQYDQYLHLVMRVPLSADERIKQNQQALKRLAGSAGSLFSGPN